MATCERAVASAPDDGGKLDSRGMARALTGDYSGAVEDFRRSLEWGPKNGQSEERIRQRQDRIQTLQANQHPFNADDFKTTVGSIERRKISVGLIFLFVRIAMCSTSSCSLPIMRISVSNAGEIKILSVHVCSLAFPAVGCVLPSHQKDFPGPLPRKSLRGGPATTPFLYRRCPFALTNRKKCV